MTRREGEYVLVCCALLGSGAICSNGYATPQDQQVSEPPVAQATQPGDKNSRNDLTTKQPMT